MAEIHEARSGYQDLSVPLSPPIDPAVDEALVDFMARRKSELPDSYA